jgi:endonuclease YncB( thermonuclease family)
MQILPTVLVATVAITQTIPFGSRPRRSEAVAVTAVTGGDTITVTKYGRVRLLGIKAPELGRGPTTSAPFAQEARDRLSELVLRRWVRLEHDGGVFDEHRRQPAYVFREDGAFINAALVRDGLARVAAHATLARLDELKHAEADARSYRRGMWGSAPRVPRPGYTRDPTQP